MREQDTPSLATDPSVSRKKYQKKLKKGVDSSRKRWYYKQVADASDYRTLKTEQEPRKKRMCGSSIFSEMYDLKVKIISF